MEENNTSLWNKNVNDLTVGDTVKITVVTTAACAVFTAGCFAVLVVGEKLSDWNQNRKVRKHNNAAEL